MNLNMFPVETVAIHENGRRAVEKVRLPQAVQDYRPIGVKFVMWIE